MTKNLVRYALLFALVASCSASGANADPQTAARAGSTPRAPKLKAGEAEAIFAGGCFWCMETAFEGVEGVISSVSGYLGGKKEGPSYEEVSSGNSGHYEAVRVVYDPKRISYEKLLDIFVHNIDPTQGDGQFCDHGPQYRSAVFVANDAERALAKRALETAEKTLKKKVVTEVLNVSPFFVAEDYHQDFFRTHKEHYTAYRLGCGRDARLRALWGSSAGH